MLWIQKWRLEVMLARWGVVRSLGSRCRILQWQVTRALSARRIYLFPNDPEKKSLNCTSFGLWPRASFRLHREWVKQLQFNTRLCDISWCADIFASTLGSIRTFPGLYLCPHTTDTLVLKLCEYPCSFRVWFYVVNQPLLGTTLNGNMNTTL